MTSTPLRVTVNGRRRRLERGTTLAEVVEDTSPGTARGIAVAVNGHVVPRRDWADTTLSPDDRVEVLTAVQGG